MAGADAPRPLESVQRHDSGGGGGAEASQAGSGGDDAWLMYTGVESVHYAGPESVRAPATLGPPVSAVERQPLGGGRPLARRPDGEHGLATASAPDLPMPTPTIGADGGAGGGSGEAITPAPAELDVGDRRGSGSSVVAQRAVSDGERSPYRTHGARQLRTGSIDSLPSGGAAGLDEGYLLATVAEDEAMTGDGGGGAGGGVGDGARSPMYASGARLRHAMAMTADGEFEEVQLTEQRSRSAGDLRRRSGAGRRASAHSAGVVTAAAHSAISPLRPHRRGSLASMVSGGGRDQAGGAAGESRPTVLAEAIRELDAGVGRTTETIRISELARQLRANGASELAELRSAWNVIKHFSDEQWVKHFVYPPVIILAVVLGGISVDFFSQHTIADFPTLPTADPVTLPPLPPPTDDYTKAIHALVQIGTANRGNLKKVFATFPELEVWAEDVTAHLQRLLGYLGPIAWAMLAGGIVVVVLAWSYKKNRQTKYLEILDLKMQWSRYVIARMFEENGKLNKPALHDSAIIRSVTIHERDIAEEALNQAIFDFDEICDPKWAMQALIGLSEGCRGMREIKIDEWVTGRSVKEFGVAHVAYDLPTIDVMEEDGGGGGGAAAVDPTRSRWWMGIIEPILIRISQGKSPAFIAALLNSLAEYPCSYAEDDNINRQNSGRLVFELLKNPRFQGVEAVVVPAPAPAALDAGCGYTVSDSDDDVDVDAAGSDDGAGVGSSDDGGDDGVRGGAGDDVGSGSGGSGDGEADVVAVAVPVPRVNQILHAVLTHRNLVRAHRKEILKFLDAASKKEMRDLVERHSRLVAAAGVGQQALPLNALDISVLALRARRCLRTRYGEEGLPDILEYIQGLVLREFQQPDDAGGDSDDEGARVVVSRKLWMIIAFNFRAAAEVDKLNGITEANFAEGELFSCAKTILQYMHEKLDHDECAYFHQQMIRALGVDYVWRPHHAGGGVDTLYRAQFAVNNIIFELAKNRILHTIQVCEASFFRMDVHRCANIYAALQIMQQQGGVAPGDHDEEVSLFENNLRALLRTDLEDFDRLGSWSFGGCSSHDQRILNIARIRAKYILVALVTGGIDEFRYVSRDMARGDYNPVYDDAWVAGSLDGVLNAYAHIVNQLYPYGGDDSPGRYHQTRLQKLVDDIIRDPLLQKSRFGMVNTALLNWRAACRSAGIRERVASDGGGGNISIYQHLTERRGLAASSCCDRSPGLVEVVVG